MFFLDIDGTVFNNGCISKNVKLSVKRAREKGHKVFINTGRPRADAKRTIGSLKIDGLISAIGTCIEINGNIIHHTSFTKKEIEKIFDLFQNEKQRLTFDTENFKIYNGFHENKELTPIVKSKEELFHYLKNENTAKCIASGNLEKDLTEYLSKNYCFFNHGGYSEFCKKNHSKSIAMQKVLNYYKKDVADSVAIGDSANDFDMLKFSGISIAMGNATKEIKDICDYVTLSADKDGVSYAIEQILNNKWIYKTKFGDDI